MTRSEIGLEPLEPLKTGDGRRMRILDAKSEAGLAANYVQVESADGETRRKFVLVRFGSQSLRFCGAPATRKSEGILPQEDQGDGLAFQVKDGKMCGSSREMDFAVGRGAGELSPGWSHSRPARESQPSGLRRSALCCSRQAAFSFCQEVSCETAVADSSVSNRAMKVRLAERFLKCMKEYTRKRKHRK